MNQGVVRSSPVQQMVAAGGPSWYTRPPPHHPNFLAAPPHNHQPLSASSPSWNDACQELPESWSQLLLGGLVSEEEKGSMVISHMEQSSDVHIDSDSYGLVENHELIQEAPKPNITNCWAQIHQIISPAANSPKSSSCVTTSLSSHMLNFSHKFPDSSIHECNSTGTSGPAAKKARIQPPPIQSTFKVRKEKLGDRITALHQLVSPFGKTDTASVLLEAIGYIRFLQCQVEALSLPYLGIGSTSTHLHPVEVERNYLFPDDPGQLLMNEKCIKRKTLTQQGSDEKPKEDLRSRGLCLVPISCTLQLGNENAADYWAPAFGGNI